MTRFCTECGNSIKEEEEHFCPSCGAKFASTGLSGYNKKLL